MPDTNRGTPVSPPLAKAVVQSFLSDAGVEIHHNSAEILSALTALSNAASEFCRAWTPEGMSSMLILPPRAPLFAPRNDGGRRRET